MVRMDDTSTRPTFFTTNTISTTTSNITMRTTVTDTSTGTSITTYALTNYYVKKDYKPDYKEDDREMMMEGWYNPKKISITVKCVKKRIDLKIRNRLLI